MSRGVGKPQYPPLNISVWERIPGWVYIVVIAALILALAIGLPVYLGMRHHSH